MILKQSLTARCVVALTALALAAQGAPKNDKKKKGDDDKKTGSSMEEGGKDPAATETFEEGQFVPGKKKPPPKRAAGEEGDEEEGEATEAAPEAKPEPEKPIKVRKTVGLFAEAIIGFGKAPEPGPGPPDTQDATSFGFMIGGHADLSNPFRVMIRVPVSTGTIKAGSGQDTHETAFGVPEVAGRLRLGEPSTTEWAIKLGVGVPIGQANPDITSAGTDARGWEQARLQRVVNAANGWHDPELYTLKRVPVSPSLLFLYRGDKLRINADLKAVFLPKIGGSVNNPSFSPNGTYEYNGLGVWTVLGGSISYEVLSKKYLALAAWASYEIARDYEWNGGNPPSPLQFVMEPRILAQFGKVVPSVGFLIPLGGQLGGNIYGLRLHVDVVF